MKALALVAVLLAICREVVAELNTNYPPSVHRCVWAGNKVRKQGDGSTPGSCSSCDPTTSECPIGCQELIDTLYWSCAEVTLPDGYYFDPKYELEGTWETAQDTMKINVERCGCNSALRRFEVSKASVFLACFFALLLALV